MQLSPAQIKALLAPNSFIPLVGLINKVTQEILLAPCIPPKVYLILNENDEATSGYFINSDSSRTQKLNETNLRKVNEMLKQGYVPRLAEYVNDDEQISAHMFLYKQHTSSRRSEWGGFGVSRSRTGELKFTFDSAAFNSKPGKRTKGAQLDFELQAIVIEAMNTLVEPPTSRVKENVIQNPNDGRSTPTNVDTESTPDEDEKDIQTLRNMLS